MSEGWLWRGMNRVARILSSERDPMITPVPVAITDGYGHLAQRSPAPMRWLIFAVPALAARQALVMIRPAQNRIVRVMGVHMELSIAGGETARFRFSPQTSEPATPTVVSTAILIGDPPLSGSAPPLLGASLSVTSFAAERSTTRVAAGRCDTLPTDAGDIAVATRNNLGDFLNQFPLKSYPDYYFDVPQGLDLSLYCDADAVDFAGAIWWYELSEN